MRIPDISINRLSLYLRSLKELSSNNVKTVSSKEIAFRLGINSHKVRKDLSYFGQFGRPGVGYSVRGLIDCITHILGLDKRWNVAVCGAGNLGSALFGYRGFREQGFRIVAVFDNHPAKIGKKWDKIKIQSPEMIHKTVKAKGIEIAIITVPADSAQEVVDAFIKAGIKTILNFAPTEVFVPKDKVKLRNVDLSMELVTLSHFLAQERLKNP